MAKLEEKSILSIPSQEALAKITISPESAFILSRLDGRTDIATIGFMAGIEVDKVLEVLQPLLDQGLVEVKAVAKKSEAKVGSILDLLDHEENDARYSRLPREFRRELLLLFSRLGSLSHYELFDLKRSASATAIKDRFFELSKKFHPDKFFSKDIGHYQKKLNRVFEKVNEAYNVLVDKKSRREYDKTLRDLKSDSPKKKQGKLKLFKQQEVENMSRARRYFEWGEEDYIRGEYVSAASNFLLALSFDKQNPEYQKAYNRVKPFVDRKKTRELYDSAEKKMEEESLDEAYDLIKQALKINPRDGNCLLKAGRLAILAKLDPERAKKYNNRALSVLGETSYGYVTASLIYDKKRDYKKALAALEKALEIDPADEQIRNMLVAMQEKQET